MVEKKTAQDEKTEEAAPKGVEAAEGNAQAEEKVPTGDRVVVKPDGQGGYTVEKFGASTHFTATQWENLGKAVQDLEKE